MRLKGWQPVVSYEHADVDASAAEAACGRLLRKTWQYREFCGCCGGAEESGAKEPSRPRAPTSTLELCNHFHPCLVHCCEFTIVENLFDALDIALDSAGFSAHVR